MKWFGLNDQAKERLIRLVLLIPTIAIGTLIYSYLHGIWTDYWLSKDAKQNTALITTAHPKRVFDYKYSVDGKEYIGTSWRDWEDEESRALRVGEESPRLFLLVASVAVITANIESELGRAPLSCLLSLSGILSFGVNHRPKRQMVRESVVVEYSG